MADIRNKHNSLPGHKMPMEIRAHYEDITDSIIPVYPMYMHATKCGAYKISFSDHSKSMKNVVHRLQSIQNRSTKSEFVSPFASNKINNSAQWRV